MRNNNKNVMNSQVSGRLSNNSSSKVSQNHSPLIQSGINVQSRQNSVSSMGSKKYKIEVKEGKHFINIEPNTIRKALIIVDVQNDYSVGGAVPVNGSLNVINKINSLRELNCFDVICLSRDWHPKNHISFASSHNKDK